MMVLRSAGPRLARLRAACSTAFSGPSPGRTEPSPALRADAAQDLRTALAALAPGAIVPARVADPPPARGDRARGVRRAALRVLQTALGICGLGFFAWAWNSQPIKLVDRIFPRNLAAVYPESLYRSGQIAPHLIEGTLEDLRIDL